MLWVMFVHYLQVSCGWDGKVCVWNMSNNARCEMPTTTSSELQTMIPLLLNTHTHSHILSHPLTQLSHTCTHMHTHSHTHNSHTHTHSMVSCTDFSRGRTGVLSPGAIITNVAYSKE